MKPLALREFRHRLTLDQPQVGVWITLEAPSLTEMAVGLGCDWVVIDAEHGHLDWHDVVAHVRATVRSSTLALVRIAELNASLMKRALDIGADGVVVPFIETADQLARAMSYARFPPEGTRGIGAERATCWGQTFAEHAARANDDVLVVPILETVSARQNLDALLDVPGTEVFFFGPADYSASAGHRGLWEGPGVAEQLLDMKDQIRAAGKHAGIVTTSETNLIERRGQGFRMLGLGLDVGLFLRSLHGALATVGRDRRFQPDLSLPPREVDESP